SGGEHGNRRGRRAVQADSLEQTPRAADHLAAVDSAKRAVDFIAQENVAGDIEVRREHQLLVDQDDALALRVVDRAERDLTAIDEQLPFVGWIRAAENF